MLSRHLIGQEMYLLPCMDCSGEVLGTQSEAVKTHLGIK